MEDTLHNILPEVLVTKQNLIDQEFKIEKKFVMVDSRAYTEDAFEYVLKLADIAGSLVFVYDLKKIWANGRYFGGDVFQEDLHYWTTITTIDGGDILTGETTAISPKSNLVIKGKSHLSAKAIFTPENYEKNIIEFDYKLKDAVNTNFVEIDGNRYNLVVEDDQIKLNKYEPMKVICSSLPVLEYDSILEYAEVSFNLTLSGTMPDPSKVILDIQVSINGEQANDLFTGYDVSTGTVHAQIPRNTVVTFTIAYSDGITGGTTSVTQRWGYGVWIGIFDQELYGYGLFGDYKPDFLTNQEGTNGVEGLKKYLWVPGANLNITESLNQTQSQYGMFVCPADFNIEFVDVSTNLTGGWTPGFNQTGYLYEDNILYMPYRTDHVGLGLVTWKIKGTKS